MTSGDGKGATLNGVVREDCAEEAISLFEKVTLMTSRRKPCEDKKKESQCRELQYVQRTKSKKNWNMAFEEGF